MASSLSSFFNDGACDDVAVIRAKSRESLGNEDAEIPCLQYLTKLAGDGQHSRCYQVFAVEQQGQNLLSLLVERLGSASPEIRTYILSCLNALSLPEYLLPAFISALGNSSWQVRMQAILALQILQSFGTVQKQILQDALTRSLETESFDLVKQAAKQTLVLWQEWLDDDFPDELLEENNWGSGDSCSSFMAEMRNSGEKNGFNGSISSSMSGSAEFKNSFDGGVDRNNSTASTNSGAGILANNSSGIESIGYNASINSTLNNSLSSSTSSGDGRLPGSNYLIPKSFLEKLRDPNVATRTLEEIHQIILGAAFTAGQDEETVCLSDTSVMKKLLDSILNVGSFKSTLTTLYIVGDLVSNTDLVSTTAKVLPLVFGKILDKLGDSKLVIRQTTVKVLTKVFHSSAGTGNPSIEEIVMLIFENLENSTDQCVKCEALVTVLTMAMLIGKTVTSKQIVPRLWRWFERAQDGRIAVLLAEGLSVGTRYIPEGASNGVRNAATLLERISLSANSSSGNGQNGNAQKVSTLKCDLLQRNVSSRAFPLPVITDEGLVEYCGPILQLLESQVNSSGLDILGQKLRGNGGNAMYSGMPFGGSNSNAIPNGGNGMGANGMCNGVPNTIPIVSILKKDDDMFSQVSGSTSLSRKQRMSVTFSDDTEFTETLTSDVLGGSNRRPIANINGDACISGKAISSLVACGTGLGSTNATLGSASLGNGSSIGATNLGNNISTNLNAAIGSTPNLNPILNTNLNGSVGSDDLNSSGSTAGVNVVAGNTNVNATIKNPAGNTGNGNGNTLANLGNTGITSGENSKKSVPLTLENLLNKTHKGVNKTQNKPVSRGSMLSNGTVSTKAHSGVDGVYESDYEDIFGSTRGTNLGSNLSSNKGSNLGSSNSGSSNMGSTLGMSNENVGSNLGMNNNGPLNGSTGNLGNNLAGNMGNSMPNTMNISLQSAMQKTNTNNSNGMGNANGMGAVSGMGHGLSNGGMTNMASHSSSNSSMVPHQNMASPAGISQSFSPAGISNSYVSSSPTKDSRHSDLVSNFLSDDLLSYQTRMGTPSSMSNSSRADVASNVSTSASNPGMGSGMPGMQKIQSRRSLFPRKKMAFVDESSLQSSNNMLNNEYMPPFSDSNINNGLSPEIQDRLRLLKTRRPSRANAGRSNIRSEGSMIAADKMLLGDCRDVMSAGGVSASPIPWGPKETLGVNSFKTTTLRRSSSNTSSTRRGNHGSNSGTMLASSNFMNQGFSNHGFNNPTLNPLNPMNMPFAGPNKAAQARSSADYGGPTSSLPPPDQVPTEKTFSDLLANLQPGRSWSSQADAIDLVRRIMKFHPDFLLMGGYCSNGSMQVKTDVLLPLLSGLCENSRSTVAKSALVCLQDMAMVQPNCLEKVLYCFLKKCGDKSFVNDIANRGLDTLSTTCGDDSRLALAFSGVLLESRGTLTSAGKTRLLQLIVAFLQKSKTKNLPTSILVELVSNCSILISDSSADVKGWAKNVCQLFAGNHDLATLGLKKDALGKILSSI